LSTKNPHGLTWAQTQVCAVRGQWLTTCAMAQPTSTLLFVFCLCYWCVRKYICSSQATLTAWRNLIFDKVNGDFIEVLSCILYPLISFTNKGLCWRYGPLISYLRVDRYIKEVVVYFMLSFACKYACLDCIWLYYLLTRKVLLK
jgi:hypothetical protein